MYSSGTWLERDGEIVKQVIHIPGNSRAQWAVLRAIVLAGISDFN